MDLTKDKIPVDQYGHLVTRAGQRARLVATNVRHKYYPVLALIEMKSDGMEFAHQYTTAGRIYYSEDRPNEGDLLTVAEYAQAQQEEMFK